LKAASIKSQNMLTPKDDFIAIASHQVSTRDVALRAGLDRVYASALKMEQLIEGLLRFAAVEQSSVRPSVSPYQPDLLVRMNAERILNDFKAAGISLSLDLNFTGTIDLIAPASLEMAVSNLIENAFHYTPRGGSVTVRTKRADTGGLEVEVEDTGMGIPREMHDRIFVKFRRSQEAQKRNEGGPGVGLYIV
jgi:signal transduction histidine kinase